MEDVFMNRFEKEINKMKEENSPHFKFLMKLSKNVLVTMIIQKEEFRLRKLFKESVK